MKKILLVVSLLFSVPVFAHSGHTLFEFNNIIEVIRHHFSSPYHVVVLLLLCSVFAVSAMIVIQRRKIYAATLMVFALIGSALGMGVLLS